MKNHKLYSDKFTEFSKNKLFQTLNNSMQSFIRFIGESYRLTFQELRMLTEMTVDFNMWGETDMEMLWKKVESSIKPSQNRPMKNQILSELREHWDQLKIAPSFYDQNAPKVKNVIRKLKDRSDENTVLGLCPVASDKTVCCNLLTIDAVQGCGLGCSYCSIQTFYEDGAIGIETDLAGKLRQIELDRDKTYHIGSGQSSDSLAMGNKNGILDAQLDFAKQNPNIIFEFKTKTKNIDYFLTADLPKNILVCWSLNPQIIIDHEEHFTASLKERIHAARLLADMGVLVGFHFHPIVYYEGFKEEYQSIVKQLLSTFTPSEIGMISFGTLTFIKPAVKRLRALGVRSKVLQMPLEDAAGKFSYPFHIKQEIFGSIWNSFTPWHTEVFFYFCMEESNIWEAVMGTYFSSNDEFEEALYKSVSNKFK